MVAKAAAVATRTSNSSVCGSATVAAAVGVGAVEEVEVEVDVEVSERASVSHAADVAASGLVVQLVPLPVGQLLVTRRPQHRPVKLMAMVLAVPGVATGVANEEAVLRSRREALPKAARWLLCDVG